METQSQPKQPDQAHTASSHESLERKIDLRISEDTVQRLFYFTIVTAVFFTGFAFTSLDFLRLYVPDLDVMANLWPRVAYNALPLLALAAYIKKSRRSPVIKVYFWLVSFCLIFCAAAMIHVWPIALQGNTEVMLYVNATNTTLFAAVAMMLSLSWQRSIVALMIIGCFVWAPIAFVCFHGGSTVAGRVITGDNVFLGIGSFVLGIAFHQVRRKLVVYELEKQEEASRFLGPIVSKAIFEDREKLFQSLSIKGFVISIDIRDSTELQKEYGQRWLEFRKDYFARVSKAVSKYGGHIQKTVGDCHVINFGVMDEYVDLSDIPGIEADEARAEERRLQRASDSAFGCLGEIFSGFQDLAQRHFEGKNIRLGAGMDKGVVERSVQGDSDTLLELDVNGDPVNCCSRLQEYSKALHKSFSSEASLLVISPFASDYLRDVSDFRRVSTLENPIRNYPSIRWVLVKEFRSAKSASESGSGQFRQAA